MSREYSQHPSIEPLSVLIPVYNVRIQHVLSQLMQACSYLQYWEIVVVDDASPNAEIELENAGMCAQNGRIRYYKLDENVGRSSIRNLLAAWASYDLLLYLDCDSALPDSDFIDRYMKHATSHPVQYGGTLYTNDTYRKEVRLHHFIGSSREMVSARQRNRQPYKYFTWNNVCIRKEIVLRYPLEERLTTYGHEDTFFAQMLMEHGYKVHHIDNPVEHLGLETDEVFLKKTCAAVENLYLLHTLGFHLKESTLWRARERYHFLLLIIPRGVLRLKWNSLKWWLLHATPSGVCFDMFKLIHLSLCERDQPLIKQKVHSSKS